jgi:hypothetical protein
MDAESAAAMWQEANCPIRTQRIILRHLFHFFGRRITVPEQKIRDLEQGAVHPITDSALIGGKEIFFWYKEIDEVIISRLKREVSCRGRAFFLRKGYNQVDIVFGGDHGARRFRAMVRILFRNNLLPLDTEPYSIIMQVGSIEAAKDTREIIEGTIGVHLNNGLKRIVDKMLVVHLLDGVNDSCEVTLAEEPPALQNNNTFLSFSIRSFITGDLAFFATILGKENMSAQWCTWCQLSKKEWKCVGHATGAQWSIQQIQDLRRNVQENNLEESPENIRGCTKDPLFDAVPVENYIVSVLHILIGVGNTLLESLLEWIEERIEAVSMPEIIARNEVIFAEAHFNRIQNDYDRFLEEEGVYLVDKQVDKAATFFLLHEKVIYFWFSL